MVTEEKVLGARGEDLAGAYFTQRGFRVVCQNWSCRLGEIDLVVEKEGMTHFVEVKTRQTLMFGYPEEAVTRLKIRHLERAIHVYLEQHPEVGDDYQADVLAITWLPGTEPEYYYIEAI